MKTRKTFSLHQSERFRIENANLPLAAHTALSKANAIPKELTGKRQNGSVLVISLILLMLLTMIGVSAMQNTGLEERMAGNMRNRNLAFQAAESALRAGEAVLGAHGALPDFTGANGMYESNAAPPGAFADWTNNTVEFSEITGHVAQAPRYVIQRVIDTGGPVGAGIPTENQMLMYRVTARGVGGTDTAVAVVQSTFKR